MSRPWIFLTIVGLAGYSLLTGQDGLAAMEGKSIRVALVQFDAKPGQVEENLLAMERLARQAAENHARLVMFHELALSDYMDDMWKYAEPIPEGPSVRRMEKLAADLGCFLVFGMPERNGDRLHIAQVFVGPEGFLYRYRKTWLFQDPEDRGYRNEWARYNPGQGPELFVVDGIRSTCLICADSDAPRSLEQVRSLKPDLIFFPVNRGAKSFPEYHERIGRMGAVTLVTNRVGDSHGRDCVGGAAIYDAKGNMLAVANRDKREEILYYDLSIPADGQ